MEIKVAVEYDAIRIRINGTLHLNVIRSKLLGGQSWIQESRKMFFIEYTMEGGTILSEYDDAAKFKLILDQLDKVL